MGGNYIWLPYMTESLKTTVYLTGGDYRRLKQLARQQRRPAAELVREAVAEYVQRRTRRLRPRSLGAFRSGIRNLAERAEELLEGMGEE